MRLQPIEIRPAYADAACAQLAYGAIDFLRCRLRVRQIGVAPEIEMIWILAAECRQFVVTNTCIFVCEITGPVHEAVRRGGHDEFVEAPLRHQLASAFMGHSCKEVGLSFLIRRRFGGLLGAEREIGRASCREEGGMTG